MAGPQFPFFSSDMPEPLHVHIAKDRKSAKAWLQSLEVEYAHGYNERELKALLAVVAENRDEWIRSWNEFFGF